MLRSASLQMLHRPHRSGPVSPLTRATNQPLGSFITPTRLGIGVRKQTICGANANIWSGWTQITRPLHVR